ncbi:peptidase inhibitor family I36 [Saccharothrix australiensis]|uniref:Peptidase inhibitor family I36 n=2 Tax=Saccharothrix australiensis TaxID=2072 RepID=A0A495W3Y3_9PSEU|nr:peptidase inhibitor family I36 [Saccharothrix australiensis]
MSSSRKSVHKLIVGTVAALAVCGLAAPAAAGPVRLEREQVRNSSARADWDCDSGSVCFYRQWDGKEKIDERPNPRYHDCSVINNHPAGSVYNRLDSRVEVWTNRGCRGTRVILEPGEKWNLILASSAFERVWQ